MAWSYSALKDYEGCARRYHEVKVLKNYPFVESEAIMYGHEVHKAAELYVKRNKAIPEKYKFIQPLIDVMLKKPGRPYAEFSMSLLSDLSTCGWTDKKTWVRSKADLMVLDDENKKAWVIDYKTGSAKYPDKEQLVLMSAMVFAYFPHLEVVNSALAYVVNDNFIKEQVHKRELKHIWQDYRERVAKIDRAHEVGVWNPTSSGLCKKHCPVLTCEHNGRS